MTVEKEDAPAAAIGIGEQLEALTARLTALIAPFAVRTKHELDSCARRGDTAGLRIWQQRSTDFKAIAARVLATTTKPQKDATAEQLAQLARDLEEAIGTIDRWSENETHPQRRS